MAFIKNDSGTLVTDVEFTGEGFELVPGEGYITCKIIDTQIHYFGAPDLASLVELAASFGGEETESTVVAWMKANVGPTFLDGTEL